MSDRHDDTDAGIKTEIVRAQVVRLQWTVQMGLVLACLLVPLTRVSAEDEDELVHSLFGTLAYFMTESAEDLGSTDAFPYALAGGRIVTLVGVALTALSLVLLVVVSSMLHGHNPPRRGNRLVVLVGAALLISAVLVWLGQVWLPDDDDLAYTGAWGLFVVAATAVWAIQTARGPVGINE